jgi:hypothetical protein
VGASDPELTNCQWKLDLALSYVFLQYDALKHFGNVSKKSRVPTFLEKIKKDQLAPLSPYSCMKLSSEAQWQLSLSEGHRAFHCQSYHHSLLLTAG